MTFALRRSSLPCRRANVDTKAHVALAIGTDIVPLSHSTTITSPPRQVAADDSAVPSPAATSLRPLAAVVAVAAVVTFPTLGFDFVLYDDDYLVYRNSAIRDLGNIASFFDPWADREQMGSEYLPLTTLSFAIDYALFGLDPRGFHATNAVLYILLCSAVYLLLRQLGVRPWGAAIGAALFAVHPLHTENFAWIAERKGLLSGVFALFAVSSYIAFRRRGDGVRWLCLSILCYLGAFLSKYTAASLPAVLLAYEVLFVRGDGSARRWARVGVTLLPFAVIGAALTWLVIGIGHAHAIVKTHDSPLVSAAQNDPIILLHYVRLLFLPLHQCAFYLWPTRTGWEAAAFFGYGVVAVMLALAWKSRLRAPLLAFAIAWFLAFLLPVLNVVPKGLHLAERYLLLPSVALSLLAAVASEAWAPLWSGRPRLRRTALALAVLALVTLGSLSLSRGEVWRDSFRLWNETLAHPMANPAAYNQLGLAQLTQASDPHRAADVFELGLTDMQRRGTPSSPLALELRFHLILSYLESARVDEARREWELLQRISRESAEKMDARIAGWRRDLEQHYPQLFSR